MELFLLLIPAVVIPLGLTAAGLWWLLSGGEEDDEDDGEYGEGGF